MVYTPSLPPHVISLKQSGAPQSARQKWYTVVPMGASTGTRPMQPSGFARMRSQPTRACERQKRTTANTTACASTAPAAAQQDRPPAAVARNLRHLEPPAARATSQQGGASGPSTQHVTHPAQKDAQLGELEPWPPVAADDGAVEGTDRK